MSALVTEHRVGGSMLGREDNLRFERYPSETERLVVNATGEKTTRTKTACFWLSASESKRYRQDFTAVLRWLRRLRWRASMMSALAISRGLLTFSPEMLGDKVDAMPSDVEQRLSPLGRAGLITETGVSKAKVARSADRK
jgi:hypothetical protein